MHPTVDDLLSLREGAPAAPGVASHLAQCAACRATAADLDALAGELRAMPVLEPPADAWAAVVARLGPPVRVHPATARWRLAAAGLAASLVLAFTLSLNGALDRGAGEVVPQGGQVATLAELKRQSQRLETVLHSLGGTRVVTANAAAEIATLEDHIALVDWQLADADGALDAEAARALWQRRVELMQDLVLVRTGTGRDDNSI